MLLEKHAREEQVPRQSQFFGIQRDVANEYVQTRGNTYWEMGQAATFRKMMAAKILASKLASLFGNSGRG